MLFNNDLSHIIDIEEKDKALVDLIVKRYIAKASHITKAHDPLNTPYLKCLEAGGGNRTNILYR